MTLTKVKQYHEENLIQISEGTFHYPAALSLFEQKSLVKSFLKIQDTFYIPTLRSGHAMNLKMTCLGSHWSAKDYRYHDTRTDVDKKPVLPINETLISLAAKFCQKSFPKYDKGWDVVICNYYEPKSTLGLHKDNSESLDSLEDGDPIVSFSIGATCDFQFGGVVRSDLIKNIKLTSGDVFVFGGSDRLKYHGVKKIHSMARSPFGSFLKNGRLNFTLRKL